MKLRQIAVLSTLALTLLSAGRLTAEPSLRDTFVIDGIKIYADHRVQGTFYLHPMPARIAKGEDGRPDIGLTLTYYTGSQVRDDAARDDVRWALRIGLDRKTRTPAQYEAIRQELVNRTSRPVALRNLSLRRMPVTVVYAPIDTPEERIELSPGQFEESIGDGTYWTRRTINLALERTDGTVLRAALENQGAIMGIAYTYVADGYVKDESGSAEQLERPDRPVWNRVTEVIDGDAISVELDTDSFPGALQIVDLDSMAPPGYPGLTIVCVDFLEDPDDWMFEETEIRVEAESVTGRPIRALTRFPGLDPEVSLQRVAFQYAVRVDRPFRYQVRAYDIKGRKHESDWVEVSEWGAPVMASASYMFTVQ